MEVAQQEPHPSTHVQSLLDLIEEALPSLVAGREPESLYAPVRYVLDGNGKRLRPLLLLLSAETFGVAPRAALPAALAIEVFHNFTLVHDDIMDHASSRRGRPTVHVRWDESTAILAGDLMLALSYELLFQIAAPSVAEVGRRYSQMVARLCEGQALDKEFETRDDVSVEDYLRMVDGKTAALLETALELGGLLGHATPAQCATLREVGRHVGRAFQIQDDLLDLVADHAQWGKTIGGDLIEGKKTFLLLRTLERAAGNERNWFIRVQEGGLPASEVPEAHRRMAGLGVLEEAQQAVWHHSTAAIQCLEGLPEVPAVATLQWLIEQMQARLH